MEETCTLIRAGPGNAHAGILFFLTAIAFIIIRLPLKCCRMYVSQSMVRALHGYDARHVRPTVLLNAKRHVLYTVACVCLLGYGGPPSPRLLG